MRQVSMATRDELLAAIADRYARSGRLEKVKILDEFVAITKMHRKHVQRLLRRGGPIKRSGARPGRRIYDVSVQEALILVWESADRICGKRLKSLVPTLVESMERHGHLRLKDDVRSRLLSMSAATIDRSLREVKVQAGGRRRRRTLPSTSVRRSVPVKTFSDWDDPKPGFFEADLVAHSGPRGQRKLYPNISAHGHCYRMDRVHAGSCAGTNPLNRSSIANAAPIALRCPRSRYRQ
jgi:hypothetical protein